MMTHWTRKLQRLSACADAVEWCKGYDTAQSAWDACERGNWMLWLWGRNAGEPWSDARRSLVMACCECARLALPHVPPGELRPLQALECAESWARGEHDDREKLRSSEAYAADASAYAATNAASAAYATASYAADATASYATYATAGLKTLKQCADIVRKHMPTIPLNGARNDAR